MAFTEKFFKRALLALCVCVQTFTLWADVKVPLTEAEQQAEQQRKEQAAAQKPKVSVLQTNARMAEESRIVVYCLERMHYLRTPIKRVNTQDILNTYFKDLDPAKLFFTEGDLEELRQRFSPTLDVFLQQGNLLPAFAIFQTYRERVRERCQWIAQRLKEPFDFTVDETFFADRKKAQYSQNIQELDELWNKRLKFELLNESLASPRKKDKDKKDKKEKTPADEDADEQEKKPKTFEERLVTATKNLAKRYERFLKATEEIESVEVQEIYLNSVASVYDPHSGFLSPYYLEEFDISMRNALVGIGAVLSDKDGYCTIRELIAGGPAERSGKFSAGDKIVGVAQGEDGEMVDVIGMKLRKVVRQIRGKKGSLVRLSVQPAEGDPSDRTDITLERDEIKLTDNLAKAELYEVPAGAETAVKVGVIDLPAFYGASDDGGRSGTSEDVKELVQTLKGQGMQALVLDLRRNGGGYLNEAIDLTGLFVAGGPVLQVRDAQGKVQELRDRMKNALAWNGPLVVLISKMSASATEIVAGALQNHNRVVLVGDAATHGKGTVQAVYPFKNLIPNQKGAAKVTIQKWYLPDGNSIQVKGIASDIALPSSLDALPIGEGDLDRALPWDSIPPVRLDPRPAEGFLPGVVSDQLLKTLLERSLNRGEMLPEFSLLNEQVKWNSGRAEKKEFSLSRTVRERERDADTAMRDRLEDQLETMADSLNYQSEKFKLEAAKNQKDEKQLNLTDEEEEILGVQKPVFDIRLREGLRVAADWYTLAHPAAPKEPAQ